MTQSIKSRQRVSDFVEVFTSEREVKAMCDLAKDETYRIDSKVLEPACGDGNFLAEILNRKLSTVESRHSKNKQDAEMYSVIAVTSHYGIDIQEDNANDDDTPLTESSFSNHFITFISLGGKLWELDGLKPQPVCHGECSDLLKDSVALIQKDFLPHIKNQMEVSVCAFCGLS